MSQQEHSDPILGGWVICRPQPLVYNGTDWQGFTLMSDLHIGSPNIDYKLINKELKEAKENGDRINVNGDIFDAIVATDPRYVADLVHPKFQGRTDLLNAVIDEAAELFSPYADLIDMIGVGNHCSKIQKNSSLDLIALLIDKLRPCISRNLQGSHVIHHGGYAGFIDYRFVYNGSGAPSDSTRGKRYVISYYHGNGGGGGVNKGMGDFSKRLWVRCDLMWLGHRHCRTSNHAATMECPTGGYDPIIRERRNIMTSAYGKIYSGQTQRSIAAHGRRTSWAADDQGFAPEGLGGCRVEVKMSPYNRETQVRVIQ